VILTELAGHSQALRLADFLEDDSMQGAWGSAGDDAAAPKAAASAVAVHAIVAFGALDHFLRRQEGQQRVIGTLLGRIDGRTVTVTNSYAVPCEEGADGTVAVGQDYQEKMSRLLARVNPDEAVVGWYATPGADGAPTDDASEMIHGFYAGACAGQAPVHLVVDPRLEGDAGITLRGFVSDGNGFAEIPCELAFDRGERLCLARMVRGQREPFGSAESVADVMDADEDGLALEDALRDVDALAAYVKARRAANEDVDPKVARALNEALAALPKIEDAVARGALRAETRDVLMVSYLAGVTKAQLAIGAKLHESF
jgi:translation initiation factor 3 subunit F